MRLLFHICFYSADRIWYYIKNVYCYEKGKQMYKIFLVEDDETIAKMVKNHLEKWDYEVRIAQKFDRIMAEFADYEPQPELP